MNQRVFQPDKAFDEDAEFCFVKVQVTLILKHGIHLQPLWYTKSEKNVLMILIGRKELPSLMKEIKKLDSRAFMSVSPTNNVYGEGFEEIKAGISRNKSKNA